VFDVALGEEIVLHQLDVFERAGYWVAYDEYVEVLYSNGRVYWNGIECVGAVTAEYALEVRFVKGELDNPMVNAIMLFRG
jgi:hypothetical protein